MQSSPADQIKAFDAENNMNNIVFRIAANWLQQHINQTKVTTEQICTLLVGADILSVNKFIHSHTAATYDLDGIAWSAPEHFHTADARLNLAYDSLKNYRFIHESNWTAYDSEYIDSMSFDTFLKSFPTEAALHKYLDLESRHESKGDSEKIDLICSQFNWSAEYKSALIFLWESIENEKTSVYELARLFIEHKYCMELNEFLLSRDISGAYGRQFLISEKYNLHSIVETLNFLKTEKTRNDQKRRTACKQ